MPRVILFVLLIAVYIYTVVDIIVSDSRNVRGIPKGAWLVVVILVPLLGSVLWFTLGRPKVSNASGPAARAPRSLGPDDDPEFLRNLERRRRNQQEAQRLETLRKELEEKERRLRDGGSDAPDSKN